MKLTKAQLKRIIKEELGEARYDDPNAQEWAAQSNQELYVNLTPEQEAALQALENAVNECLAADCTDADMKDTFESRVMS